MAPIVLPPGYAIGKDLPKNPACIMASPDALPTETTGVLDPALEHNVAEPNVDNSPDADPLAVTGVPDHYLEEAVAEPDVTDRPAAPPFSAIPEAPQPIPALVCLRSTDANQDSQRSTIQLKQLNSRDFISKAGPNASNFFSSEQQTSHSETTRKHPPLILRHTLPSMTENRPRYYTEYNAIDRIFAFLELGEEASQSDDLPVWAAVGGTLGCIGLFILVGILYCSFRRLKKGLRRWHGQRTRKRTARRGREASPTNRRWFRQLVARDRSSKPPAYNEMGPGDSATQQASNSQTIPSSDFQQPVIAHLGPDRVFLGESISESAPPPSYTASPNDVVNNLGDHYELEFIPSPLLVRRI